VARPFLPSIETDLAARDATRRAQAVQRLGLLGGATHLPHIRSAFEDDSEFVSVTALRWLTALGDATEMPFILDRIDRLSTLDRRQLVSLLVDLGPDVAPLLRSTLADPERSTFARVICAESLRWLSDGSAADEAARLLQHNPPDELTAALLRLVRRVGRPEHAALVRDHCHHDVFFVRIHAARALGALGSASDQPLLTRLFTSDDSRWVALNAGHSLRELGLDVPLHRLQESNHPRAPIADSLLSAPA
jgi:HEAT repeat protein